MEFTSTRDPAHTAGFAAAILQGLAPDGGLYVPRTWPAVRPETFGKEDDLPGVATHLVAPFAAGDPLAASLPAITSDAFNFPAPLVPLGKDARLSVLELFHGPTAAFKDYGARFLAACLSRLRKSRQRALTILVATSGDTGGAVAAAFHGRPGIQVAVLFPKGRVSPTQERQLTCWGGNVKSFA
ncbi:MAG: pyridoxal-phosphate dependent enzyme, partial [Steroidobacteraceae bacterium]